MEYLDQTPNDLNLCVADVDVDENQFTLLRSAEINLAKVKIKASIIGESHCMQFKFGPKNFVEVLACVPKINCESYVKYSIQETVAYGFRPSSLNLCRDLGYTVSVDIRTGRSAELLQLETLRGMRAETGVFIAHEFPTDKATPFTPVTAVQIKAVETNSIPNYLTWRTLHSYPNHNCVVTTKSSIDIR